MKKLACLLLILLLLTGCTVLNIANQSINDLVTTVLSTKSKLSNKTYVGYDLYIPKDVTLIEKNDYNSIINSNDNRYYLYLDIVAYYHKIENSYQEKSDAFYSKKININDKTGYLEINQVNDKYFIEAVYNYAKVEAYVEKETLNSSLTDILTILKNIEYKDIILGTLIGEVNLKSSEERINIFASKSNDDNFLQYIDELGDYQDTENELPDEDNLELNK